MTVEEAIEYWKKFKEEIESLKYDDRIDWKEQEEATDMVIFALEKQIPKKLKLTTSTRRCPICNKQMSGIRNLHPQIRYCKWCGQAIDWKE